ncbi:hypothetical protein AB1284_25750 [Bacillus sp. S2(2024)]|uniref:hypothetical protein n=1 Tax=Bacillus sp. S2(2024) TaxID=3162887 RepID=UPI003D203DB2
MYENKQEFLDMSIDTAVQARHFLKILGKQHSDLLEDAEIIEKQKLAYRIFRTGCRTNQAYISYVKREQAPPAAKKNCYEVLYKGQLIGYVAEFEQGWMFVEKYEEFRSKTASFARMRKYAVDTYIQNRIRIDIDLK